MSFLDAASGGEGPPPAAAGPQGPPQGPPQGGGPIIAALANRQRGHKPSAPGPGDNASSMTMIMQVVTMLQQALPGLPPGSPMQQDVLKATQRLSKHIPQGQPAAGVQKTHLTDMLASLAKNAMLQMIMGKQGGGAPGGGAPGGQPQAPMPSTPLPGA